MPGKVAEVGGYRGGDQGGGAPAGRIPGVQAGTALAAVASTGYFGFLAGPPLIGFVAEATSLPVALGIVSMCCMLITVRANAVGASLQDGGEPGAVPNRIPAYGRATRSQRVKKSE